MKINFNIKLKIILWFLVCITITLFSGGSIIFILLNRQLTHADSELLSTKILHIVNIEGSAVIQNVMDGSVTESKGDEYPLLSIRMTIENLRKTTTTNSPVKLETPEGLLTLDVKSIDNSELPESTEVWMYLYQSPEYPDEFRLFVLYKTGYDQTLNDLGSMFWITVLCTLGIAGGLGYVFMKKILQPITTIIRTANSMEDTNLVERIPVEKKDEIGQLAETLNHMLDRLEAAFTREKQFTSDVSHELGTPLSLIQGEASLALSTARNDEEYKTAFKNILKESDYIYSITQKLLFLSRDSTNIHIHFEQLDLNELLHELIQDLEYLCQNNDIAIRFFSSNTRKIKGDRILLIELFFNILTNAIRYTPTNGCISLFCQESGQYVLTSITDTGTGISDGDLPYIFDRFFSTERTQVDLKSGSGLGLTISKRIAELHGGMIEARSTIGTGSTFIVSLAIEGRRFEHG